MAKFKAPAELQVLVESIDNDGLGRAQFLASEHASPRTLVMRNALPGETVQARIVRRRKGRLMADAVPLDGLSSDRGASACPHFPRCGGCTMHHVRESVQLELKQSQLDAALAEHEVVAQRIREPYSAVRLGYRKKARLGVRKLGDQVLVGFRESFSNRVARLDTCMTLTPSLARLIQPLKGLIAKLSIADQIPQIELAQGDTDTAVMVRHLAPMEVDDLDLWRDFERQFKVQILLQSGGYDTLVTLHDSKPDLLGYQIPASGLYMQFQPQQFTQVNMPMNLALVRRAMAYFGKLEDKPVVDLFCGIGNFTLPLARAGAQVYGYEVAADAIAMAQHNATLNNVSHKAEFAALDLYNDDAGTAIPVQAQGLLLDPPRSGAGPNLPRWLSEFAGSDIVYVSCNPQSFAADAKVIVNAGFELAEVGIFDMFPHTAHVETMGYFRRTDMHTGEGNVHG